MKERRFYMREEYSPRDLSWEDLNRVVTETQLKERLLRAFGLKDHIYSPTFNWKRTFDILFYGEEKE